MYTLPERAFPWDQPLAAAAHAFPRDPDGRSAEDTPVLL